MANERAYFSRPDLKDLKNSICIMGISIMGQKAHRSKSLSGIAKLVRKSQFISSLVLIGDSMQRFNMAIKTKVSPDNLLSLAINYGDEWIETNTRKLKNFQLKRCSSFLTEPKYIEIYNQLTKDYAENTNDFKIALDKTVEDHLKNKNYTSSEDVKENCRAFFLEELSVIFFLYKQLQLDHKRKIFFVYPAKEPLAFSCGKKILEIAELEWLRVKVKKLKIDFFSSLQSAMPYFPGAEDENKEVSEGSSSDNSLSASSEDSDSEEKNKVFSEKFFIVKAISEISMKEVEKKPECSKAIGTYTGALFATFFEYTTESVQEVNKSNLKHMFKKLSK